MVKYNFLNKKVFEYDADASIMHNPSSIRQYIPQDLDRIVTIENRCFSPSQAYSKKHLHYLLNKANSMTLVEYDNYEIRGFIIALLRTGSNIAGIETLNVDPTYQGIGIAYRLLNSIADDLKICGLKSIRLEVSEGNTSAIRLYEKVGFRTTSFLSNYYQNKYYGTRNAYRMIKTLIT